MHAGSTWVGEKLQESPSLIKCKKQRLCADKTHEQNTTKYRRIREQNKNTTYDFSSPNFHHSGSYQGFPLKSKSIKNKKAKFQQPSDYADDKMQLQ